MRALLVAVAAVVGLGVLAGCGQVTVEPVDSVGDSRVSAEPPETLATPVPPSGKPQEPPVGTPAPPVTIGPDGPVVPAGVTQVPPAQVDATALPEHYEYRGMVWLFDDGYSLQMFAAATSGCGAVDARLLDQSDPVQVELQALDQQQGGPADGDMCTQVITPMAVTVRLDAPLGERTVRLSAVP